MGSCYHIITVVENRNNSLGKVYQNGIKVNSQLLKLPPGKSLKGPVREDFEIVRIKTDVLKSDLILKIN